MRLRKISDKVRDMLKRRTIKMEAKSKQIQPTIRATRKTRNTPMCTTGTSTNENGIQVCDLCGGEIVQVNDRGTKACFSCGAKIE